MKKLLLLSLVSIGLFSCSNDEDMFSGSTQQEIKYSQNFVTKFGQPNPNHTWGFGGGARGLTRAEWTGTQDNNIGVYTNSNEWWRYISLPNPITKEEQAKVYEAFKNARETNVNNPNWSYFFIQQVWTGTDKYSGTDANNQTKEFVGSESMDQLMCGSSEDAMGHINNCNKGTISPTTVYVAKQGDAYDPNNGEPRQLKDNELPEGIMQVCKGGTACFGFHNSTDQKWYKNYLMLEIDGAYYVGFDWEMNKDGEGLHIAPDGVYTDWIVKVVPCEYTKSPEWNGVSKRIFCEDLGSTDDFDFNDIVLDVVTVDYSNTVITIQAAGGILPTHIYAGGQDLGEIHELFGVPQNKMVNTRAYGAVERPVVVLHVPGRIDAGDVKIVVDGSDGVKYTLSAEQGKVPYKFATPLGVDWADERQDINVKYSKFNAWVADENVPFWE